jgi:hypothetical protein
MKRITLYSTIFAVLFFSSLAWAAVPQTINYQGYLRNTDGTPVNTQVSVVFALYTTSTGGTALWSETRNVTPANGIYCFQLGSATPIPASVFANDTIYLGVKVGNDAEMTPRQRLTTAPYAFRAGTADTAATAANATTIGGQSLANLDLRYGQHPVAQLPRTNTVTILDSSDTVGMHNSITIGSDGLPIISYSGAGHLKVAHCSDASCASSTITTVGAPGDIRSTSITIGSDGLPIITCNDTIGNLNVVHCSTNDCTTSVTTTIDVPLPMEGASPSITIDNNGLPVISYGKGGLKIAHCNDVSCTSAVAVTVDSSGSADLYTSIAVDSDGLPIVSYYDAINGYLKRYHCMDLACVNPPLSVTLDSTGNVGLYSSITIGSDGLPIISYYDQTNGDLKVAHCSNAACTTGIDTTTLDSIGDVGLYASITIGSDGLPVISYYDAGNGNLKLAHCYNASCTAGAVTTTLDINVGGYSSITIGSDGLPIISYYDNANGHLKVLKCANQFCVNNFSRR